MAVPSKTGRMLHALLDDPRTRWQAVDEILEAYMRANCSVERTCEHLRIQRSTLARWRRKYPMLAHEMRDADRR